MVGREWGPSSLPMALKVPWPGSSVALLLPCSQGSPGGARGLTCDLTSSQGWHLEQQSPGTHAARLFLGSRSRAGREGMSLQCLWTGDQLPSSAIIN